jgi:RNA polymerase sigma-70 factor (ECF subfamily)
MGHACPRGGPPLDGLALLYAEVARFRAAPRRRSDLRSTGGPAQRHISPSAGAAAVAAAGDTTSAAVPGPAGPPSGPLALVPSRSSAAPEPTEPAEGPDPTVADLVQRAQSGEAEAFGLLYDRYVDLVYRYVYYRVGGVALAEDLVSETFLRALRRIDSFTWQGRDFAAWLVTIARNLITDHFKSGRYRLEVTTEDILESAPNQTAEGPESQVLDALTNQTLLEAVRQLNPEQQECIVLRFLQGLSVSETAHIMGKNDGAIKALQYRAVRALARLLPEDKLR